MMSLTSREMLAIQDIIILLCDRDTLRKALELNIGSEDLTECERSCCLAIVNGEPLRDLRPQITVLSE